MFFLIWTVPEMEQSLFSACKGRHSFLNRELKVWPIV
jgi:hypothetical protein